jgi:hypothetical protein
MAYNKKEIDDEKLALEVYQKNGVWIASMNALGVEVEGYSKKEAILNLAQVHNLMFQELGYLIGEELKSLGVEVNYV